MALSTDTQYASRGIQHPNPLFDYLTTFVPRQLKSLFTYCEYLYYNSPQIFAALNKFAVYPVTDLIFETSSPKLKQKYKNLMGNTLHLKTVLTKTGIDRHVYGNSFVSVYFPFKRFLECPECKARMNIRHANYKFKVKNKSANFIMRCSECKKEVKAKVVDEKLRHPQGINIIRWDPKHIEIEQNPITGESEYFYRIPSDFRDRLRAGNKHLLATTPLAFIDCIAEKKIFKFGHDKIYHMKADAPAGIDSRWGFPPLTSTLKQFFYTAVLRKANEAISLEHIVPFRVMHPTQPTQNSDPTITISLANWINETKMNLKAWRKDPLHLMFSPIPVGVTNVGGQGRALMVTGEIKEAEDSIIAAMGIPREFIYGGLSATGSGVTLRMLENQLLNYTTQLLDQAQWISNKCSEFLGWKKVRLDFEPFKLIDDVQQKMALLSANQASGNQLLSITSTANLFGRDIVKERELRKQETLDEQKFQWELQQDTQQLQQNLAERARSSTQTEQPQGYDQQAVIAQADQIAQQLMTMDEGTRKSYLHSLQTEDMVMYSVVIQRWEELQTQNNAMMRQDMRAQQQGGGM
jgi:hypothetical protein